MMLLRLTAMLALLTAPYAKADMTWTEFDTLVDNEKKMHKKRREFELGFLKKFNLPDYNETKKLVFPGSYSSDESQAGENMCLHFTDAYSYNDGIPGLRQGFRGYELRRVENNLWEGSNKR